MGGGERGRVNCTGWVKGFGRCLVCLWGDVWMRRDGEEVCDLMGSFKGVCSFEGGANETEGRGKLGLRDVAM